MLSKMITLTRGYQAFRCEKAFLGNRHFERKGLAYCATHYHQVSRKLVKKRLLLQLFGTLCHHCDGVIEGDVFTALNKVVCNYLPSTH